MSKRNYFGPLVLALFALVFAAGLVRIFRIRMLSGDLYPAWSSLRSDPDGTRLLFDSLAGTGRFETTREYKTLRAENQLASHATILFLGSSPASLLGASNSDLDDFEKAARSGGRIVIAMDPGEWLTPAEQEKSSALEKRWGIVVDRVSEPDGRIALFFNDAPGWTRDQSERKRAVMMERPFGAGSIVVAASSEAFANRTLATRRDSSLLMRVVGPNARVVFDESHLGVEDSGSVLGLVHKYRMDGALWGLLAFTIVFVWNHSVGFPRPRPASIGAIAGYDANSGLAQLLRRQIPASRVVEECVAEWRRTNVRSRLPSPAEIKDPIAAYSALQQDLTRK